IFNSDCQASLSESSLECNLFLTVTASKCTFEDGISTQAHKRQFERPYSDPTQMRRYFMDKLDEIVRTWNPREQYAPMTAIVQSAILVHTDHHIIISLSFIKRSLCLVLLQHAPYGDGSILCFP